jgi:lipopolysaccharide transport system ATP-binding protein
MTKNIAIKVSNLTKSYKLYAQPIDRLKESLNIFGKKYHQEFYAVNDLSFEIKKGETVGIIGRNGCGKSTLLKMIAGVLTPSSGRVIANGRVSAILELGAGFNPEMTGLENIYLSNSVSGYSKEQTNQKINEIVRFSELDDFINQPVKTYSSGMKARLAFTVAINVTPEILIIDEALSVGDVAFQRKCFAKIEEIRANGTTILFVSHSENSIVSLCSRAIWLSNGSQVLDGKPKYITGLYIKYSNKKGLNKKKLRAEYFELDNTKDNAREQAAAKRDADKNKNINIGIVAEYYNPELKPTSTIHFEEKGARIGEVAITTLNDKKVNVLAQEREYKIKMEFEIFEQLNNVRLGVAIRDMQGNYYSGAALELVKHKQIKKLEKGKYVLLWDFSCQIVDGIYMIDAVILKNINRDKYFAHKIFDGYMFKVIKSDNKNIIQSHVSMVKGYELYEVDERQLWKKITYYTAV